MATVELSHFELGLIRRALLTFANSDHIGMDEGVDALALIEQRFSPYGEELMSDLGPMVVQGDDEAGQDLKPGFYRHHKGVIYEVIAVTTDRTASKKRRVAYRGRGPEVFSRTAANFTEVINTPDGPKYRFTPLSEVWPDPVDEWGDWA